MVVVVVVPLAVAFVLVVNKAPPLASCALYPGGGGGGGGVFCRDKGGVEELVGFLVVVLVLVDVTFVLRGLLQALGLEEADDVAVTGGGAPPEEPPPLLGLLPPLPLAVGEGLELF